MLLYADVALVLIAWYRFVVFVRCSPCSLPRTAFRSPPFAAAYSATPIETKRVLLSVIDCGRLCAQLGDECATFAYNRNTQECHVSNGIIYGSMGAVYGRRGYVGCPNSMGYFTYGHDLVCMKIHTGWLNYTAAVGTCQSEGAHLLVIYDEDMYTFIKWVLECIGHTGAVLIDGYDYYGNYTFTTWNGEVLPYTMWELGHPEGNGRRRCVKLNRKVHHFATAMCDGVVGKDYICQTDNA